VPDTSSDGLSTTEDARTTAAGREDAPPAGSILLTVIGTAYTVLAIAAVARTGYQALTGTATAERAGTAVALSGVAGLVYLVAAIGLRRRTPRSLLISRWCCAAELVGVIVVSLVEIGVGGFGRAAVWSGFGVGYGYLPLVLPVMGLWVTRPTALARMAASSRTAR
jgi:hypothetical protein